MPRTLPARRRSSHTSPRTSSVRPPMRSRPHVLHRRKERARAQGDSSAGGSATSSRRRFASSYSTTSGCGTTSAGRCSTAESARKPDALDRLARDVHAWVATADPTSGTPYLVPLSLLLVWRDGADRDAGVESDEPKISRRLAKSGLGPTRDVVVIEGTTQTLDAHDVSSDMGDAFAAATGFDPRTLNHALPVSPNPPAADAGVARSRRARQPRAHALRPLARGLTRR